MIYYVGDLHGRVEEMMSVDRAAIKAGVNYVIQVGDFGIRWPGSQCSMYKYFEKRSRKEKTGPTWITCGGNHDNWDKWFNLSQKQGNPDLVEVAPGCYFAQRGSYQLIDNIGHLFLGGAESTDRVYRVEGKSWWAKETPKYTDYNIAMVNLEKYKPEVVVTHDVPICVNLNRPGRENQPTPRSLQNLLKHSNHKPKRWYYGHHHILDETTEEGVNFYCCGFHGEYKVYPEQTFESLTMP